jgi:ubiquinone/menaquinone biosynthesis C-methylase UbiE
LSDFENNSNKNTQMYLETENHPPLTQNPTQQFADELDIELRQEASIKIENIPKRVIKAEDVAFKIIHKEPHQETDINPSIAGSTKDEYILSTKDELDRLENKFNIYESLKQLKLLGFEDGMSFVDIGIGSGKMTRMVAEYFSKSKTIIGVDINDSFLEFAKSKAKNNNLEQIEYMQGNIYKLPLKDNSVDFVWSRFVFEYLKDPLLALKEIRRVLKKGGIVAIGDLDGNCLNHYPLSEKLENDINFIIKLLSQKGFDPFVGRKLYSYLKETSFNQIKTFLFPYHMIAGKPNKNDLDNWSSKLLNIKKYSTSSFDVSTEYIEKAIDDFLTMIKDENVFTYSTLIFAKGIK